VGKPGDTAAAEPSKLDLRLAALPAVPFDDLVDVPAGGSMGTAMGPWTPREMLPEEGSMPRFSRPATDLTLLPTGSDEHPSVARASAALREAFTPSQPKHWSRLFTGRYDEMERIIAAIEEKRAHVVIFGERGRGKTSLANVVTEIASDAGYLVLRCACSTDLTFEEMFRGFLRRLPRRLLYTATRAARGSAPDVDNFEQLLPPGNFGATELTEVMRRLSNGHAILVIDEFDRIGDEKLKGKLAEAIKNLSDVSARVTLLIVGVAQTIEELIGNHPSIERNVVSIHLPLMSPKDIENVIRAGEVVSGVRFNDAVRAAIVRLSKGLPYYAQLLSLHAARHAVGRGVVWVERVDLEDAIDRTISEADHILGGIYERATGGGDGTTMKDAVFAAADCEHDEYGRFSAADATKVLVSPDGTGMHILTLQRALSMLATRDGGAILQKIDTDTGLRYQFANQTMRQYVLVRLARERGLV